MTTPPIVEELADRLSDPDSVRRTAETDEAWAGLSLGTGYPGVAMFYGELSRRDEGWRRVAHSYLATASAVDSVSYGVALGPAALAAAVASCTQDPRDYRDLREHLGNWLRRDQELRLATALREDDREGRPPFDVMTGLSGTGRLLLGFDDTKEVLIDTLRYLVRLTENVPTDCGSVPGWYRRTDLLGRPSHDGYGTLDLGMAHGIAGPLALLGLCWQTDVAVPGQERAIVAIAEWLCRWAILDEYGPQWPAIVTVRQESGVDNVPPTPARDAWCYGTGGISVALMHAGRALGQSRWSDLAVDAALGAVRRRVEPSTGSSICHGDAGLLQCACRIAEATGNALIQRAVLALAGEIAAAADPSAPFLYRHRMPDGNPVESPGMLTGAAGIGCALLSAEAMEIGIASHWDEALLLS